MKYIAIVNKPDTSAKYPGLLRGWTLCQLSMHCWKWRQRSHSQKWQNFSSQMQLEQHWFPRGYLASCSWYWMHAFEKFGLEDTNPICPCFYIWKYQQATSLAWWVGVELLLYSHWCCFLIQELKVCMHQLLHTTPKVQSTTTLQSSLCSAQDLSSIRYTA